MGVRLDEYFPGLKPHLFFEELNERGRRYGVFFGPQQIMCNSRLSLMGGEFAKENGKFHEYHEAVFKAFFTDCKNIGDMSVLLDIADEAGLDRLEFREAVEQNYYLDRLKETSRAARDNWVNAAPTFVIKGHGNVSGATSIDSFRTIFKKLSAVGL